MELGRYIIWAGIIAVGIGLAVLDRRWIGWPLFAALLLAGIVGGIITTKVSPFTFAGGDHSMERVIVSAASALAPPHLCPPTESNKIISVGSDALRAGIGTPSDDSQHHKESDHIGRHHMPAVPKPKANRFCFR